jgi:amino acid adenylation domain-containing protein
MVEAEHESAYGLTGPQEAILLHCLMGEENGLYHDQAIWRLEGELEPIRFRRAWEAAVRAHPVLRTGFAWEGLERPLQMVRREAALPWQEIDWSETGDAGQKQRLEAYLNEDLERGFELWAPPLMRVGLFRLAERHWQVVWSFHHILLDGRSAAMLLREISERYAAEVGGREPQLPPRWPYREYVGWLEGQDLDNAEEYWRTLLKGVWAPAPPIGGPTAETGYGSAWRELSRERTRELEEFARREHVTTSTLLHGAWGVLLNRYTNDQDVVFGSTSSGRPGSLRGAREMLGQFIDTLPVRVRAEGSSRVGAWLRELHQQLVASRSYEFSPLAHVRAEAGCGLFESVVVYGNDPIERSLERPAAGLEASSVEVRRSANHALSVIAEPREDVLRLGLTYRRERFSELQVERLLDQLQRVLVGMARSPAGRVVELPLLSEEEERRRLAVSRGPTVAVPVRCVHELVGERAAREPAGTALTEGEVRLTYGELERRANRLARYLVELGVAPERTVAVSCERSIDMVVGMLGVLKAGGAYVPLDPAYPADRLEYMLGDSGAVVVLTQSRLRGGLPATSARVVELDGDRSEIEKRSPLPVESGVRPDNLAYVIYTSGSTGEPKGVAVPHRSLVNLVSRHCRSSDLGERDRQSQFAAPAFDGSVMEIWPALAAGAQLIIAPSSVRADPSALVEWLRTLEVTVAFLPTPVAEQVFPLLAAGTCIRHLHVGGDVLHQIDGALPCTVTNHYGPTEATVYVTTSEHASSVLPVARPPIGSPIDNTMAYALDLHLGLLPTGAAGELCVGGAGVSRGYLGRPDLTAAAFVPDPFGPPGARMYRTGDQVRWLSEEVLEFLGRMDGQVKVRGYRIELGEIETTLREQAGVREAAVAVKGEAPGQKRLVGYVVRAAGSQRSFEELVAGLRRRLPEHMVPGAWVALEQLPLTAHGKLDRNGLPEPGGERPALGVGYEAPRTETERALAEIWAEVLGLERVGVNDSFFELGGDSFLSVKASLRAREVGLELGLADVFEHQTVAALARAVAGADADRSFRSS